MPDYQLPKRRRIFLMRHGDVTYFDDSGRAIDREYAVDVQIARSGQGAAGQRQIIHCRRWRADP